MGPGGRAARGPRGRRWLLPFSVIALLTVIALRPSLRRAFQLVGIWAPVLLTFRPRDEAVVSALEASGPIFIKFAQWLSTRRDLLSDELCDAMGILHERVQLPQMPADMSVVDGTVPGLHVAKEELLGGGCIAQVFVGRLEEKGVSQQVAVKVRRTGIRNLMDMDLRLLRSVAGWAQLLKPSLQWLAMPDAVDTFGRILVDQVDLCTEAQNLRKFQDNFRSRRYVHVPHVYACDEKYLITDLAHGDSLSGFLKTSHSKKLKKKVFELLVDLMAKMIMEDKFIHGDLHPGNMFVFTGKTPLGGEQPTITLIDAGISVEVSENMEDLFRHSGYAALKMRPEDLGNAVVDFHSNEGQCTHGRDLEVLKVDMGNLLLAGCFMVPRDSDLWNRTFASYEEYRGSRVSEYFGRMLDMLTRHRVRVSPRLWSVMTSFALVEGSVQELGHGVNVLRAVLPYLFPRDVFSRLQSLKRLTDSENRHQQGG